MSKQRYPEKVLTAVFSVMLIVCAVTVGRFLLQRNKEKNAEEEIAHHIEKLSEPDNEEADSEQNESAGKFTFSQEQFRYLKELNPDFTGFMAFPDAFICEPVVQGQDNEYYLSHWIDGSENSQGTVFADMDCTLSSTNITLYGHCVTYDSTARFSPLRELLNPDTYAEYDTFRIWYEDHVSEYRIIAVAYYDIDEDADFDFTQKLFPGEQSFEEWWLWFDERNQISCDRTPVYGDRFVTLQTCDGWNEDTRILFVCMEIGTKIC